MIGVGAMIGTSIFVLIGVVISEIGAAVLLVFTLNGLATIFTAATYAELGSSFPEAGGGYLWAKKALPHPAGFMSGWMSWFGHTIACSYYSLGFGFAMVAVTHILEIDVLGMSDGVLVKLFATFSILFFVAINSAGIGATGKTGTSVTIVQILIISFFVAFGAMYALDTKGIDIAENFMPIFPEESNLSELFMVMGFTFIAFEGYEIIVQCGEEVREPRKNIPRAIFLSVGFATVLYLSVAFVSLANFDTEWISTQGPSGENAVIAVGSEIIPFVGAPLLIFGGVLSAMAALNATVFSSSRVSFAMGRDGSLPRVFGVVHTTRRIPHNAIMITGSIMLFMALFFPLEVVVASTSIMFLLLFTLANVASMRLRNRLTEFDLGYRTPAFPLFPALGALISLGIAVYLWWYIPIAWYIAIVWLAIGLVASAFARPSEEAVSIVEQRRIPQRPLTKDQIRRYRVFLGLGDMADLRLVEAAGIYARYFKGELTVNTILEVPRTVPLEAISRESVEEISETLKKAIKVAPTTVKVRPIVSVSYDVAGSILDQTRHDAANLMVLGWKGTRRRGGTILGRNLDRVVREAPCDVAIMKTKRLNKNIESILLVNGGYFETRKAMLLALPLAKEYGASIVILSPITTDSQIELIRGNAERLKKMAERIKVQCELKYVHTKSFVTTVLNEAPECDILVMGAGAQSALEKTMFGAAYDRIIRSVDVPVLIVRTAMSAKHRSTAPQRFQRSQPAST
jgi:amino acid transporter/nucleotide-binding universal stress UspA family protein